MTEIAERVMKLKEKSTKQNRHLQWQQTSKKTWQGSSTDSPGVIHHVQRSERALQRSSIKPNWEDSDTHDAR